MTVHDLIGAPIPINHPKFKEDDRLRRKIRQAEGFIEIQHDMREAKEALRALRNSMKTENWKNISSLFQCFPWLISEAMLYFIIVSYAKAFMSSTGRTKLNASKIFGQEKEKHESIMNLRKKFYAHQELEANRHQLFFFPNIPSPGEIRLAPNGQTTRVVMSSSIDLDTIEFCVSRVEEFLDSEIGWLCKKIEESLSVDQIEVLIKIPKDELLSKHWIHNTGHNPFSKRGSD